MFKIDPLFPRTFLLTIPIRDIPKVLQRKLFALHEVCWTLARIVEHGDRTSRLLDEEVSYYYFFNFLVKHFSSERPRESCHKT